MKAKDPDQIAKEGAKKALFPSQPQNKESPYYQGFEAYYSPGYAQSSPSPINPSNQTSIDSQALKLKKDEEPPSPEVKVKNEACEEKKAELGPSSQQPSVIQQRSNMYMQSLYYNQYAYVPPYGYSEQGYHAHLLSSNPTYRQQYEDQQKQRQSLEQQQQQQQQRALDKKVDLGLKEREVILKEEWKQKASLPPTLTKAPSLTDLVKPGLNKAKDQGSDVAKSVIIPKLEDSTKLQGQTIEGLKEKLNESPFGKEVAGTKAGLDCGRQAEVDPVLWYRQEAEPRMWTYVYPAKYPDIKMEDERWKEERERKLKEERSRGKESIVKDDGKESVNSDCKMPSSEDSRLMGKEARSGAHVPVSSPLTQHQVEMLTGISPAGSYLPSSYSFSPYGSKSSGSEESEKSRASPIIGCKSSSESKALDILQQHASHYKSKSPTPTVVEEPLALLLWSLLWLKNLWLFSRGVYHDWSRTSGSSLEPEEPVALLSLPWLKNLWLFSHGAYHDWSRTSGSSLVEPTVVEEPLALLSWSLPWLKNLWLFSLEPTVVEEPLALLSWSLPWLKNLWLFSRGVYHDWSRTSGSSLVEPTVVEEPVALLSWSLLWLKNLWLFSRGAYHDCSRTSGSSLVEPTVVEEPPTMIGGELNDSSLMDRTVIGADDEALILPGGWSLQGLEKSKQHLQGNISEKASQERSGCGIGGSSAGCSSLGGASGAERSVDRPRSPSQRLMSTHHHHHHLGYSLLPAQYNLPYATGHD
ncbi:hypothetical protein E2320_013377 [Naja naja]|nr:hypothetical protein E2320_013377 [Naja naja]